MSAFEHDGKEYDLPDQPQITGQEFKAYRPVHFQEPYYDPHFQVVVPWRGKEDSQERYWIATCVVEKPKELPPVVVGWNFKEDEPRLPKRDEHYYSETSDQVEIAIADFWIEKYWIATRKKSITRQGAERYGADEWICDPRFSQNAKPEVKPRKIVRRKISNDTGWLRYDTAVGWEDLDTIWRKFNFLGLFEYEDGTLHSQPTAYWRAGLLSYIVRPISIEEIESGAVEIRHAVSALFWEDE